MRSELAEGRVIDPERMREVSRGHSNWWKRAGPPENGRSIPGGLTLMKARTVPGPNSLGKWSWLSKSMVLSTYCGSGRNVGSVLLE
jgi:hypothetical protein